MKIFDSFKKKGGANDAVEKEEIQDQSSRPAAAEISSSDALSSAVRDARKQALLKEHQYRAGIISFVSVVMDDLQSASEKNYPAVISMTVATLKNFIEAESRANADLLGSLKNSE
ncbi:MAG: hypothetical protein RBR01_03370 [Desulfobacterales bacterium]|nr:hypothetical protein [Desulfobacterales bacterium]MDD3080649.1 hypothetical protein [Desulfobacterales bacterium]MDD3949656.1 hypothetical protein [Desulfobacterales bacterium]MDD4463306.1 hypothetical protein [Desulfobacterales bacterium]MDY0377455.1 hypothetical protein [Desulfobacterales bacterium]